MRVERPKSLDARLTADEVRGPRLEQRSRARRASFVGSPTMSATRQFVATCGIRLARNAMQREPRHAAVVDGCEPSIGLPGLRGPETRELDPGNPGVLLATYSAMQRAINFASLDTSHSALAPLAS